MKITACLIIIAVMGVDRNHSTDQAVEFDSKLVLEQDFENPSWPTIHSANKVEFCGGDWCQEVSFADIEARPRAWDAAFIIFYFFDANEHFTRRREAVARFLLDVHGGHCRGNQVERAACTLRELQEKNGLGYRRVKYDIGYRCSSLFEVKPPYFTNVGECTEYDWTSEPSLETFEP